MEEWRHWLEGGEQPFSVWTDHKNLEYLQSAKQLNSFQACWALFFNCFNFHLSYRPRSNNTKPDALSQIHSPDPSPEIPEPILPCSCLLGAVQWEIEEQVKQAQSKVIIPENCPSNRLFVPSELRSAVIHWGHSSVLSFHPGATRL